LTSLPLRSLKVISGIFCPTRSCALDGIVAYRNTAKPNSATGNRYRFIIASTNLLYHAGAEFKSVRQETRAAVGKSNGGGTTTMARPVTLFTGQWADLPLETMAQKAREFGYDGLELACWGDHFDVEKALTHDGYCESRWEILGRHGLMCFAISNHLVGQAVCDPIDERHKAILPARVWGDGDPEGVRQRAAEEMKNTARAARRLFNCAPDEVKRQLTRVVVNGFTGSSIWQYLYSFPPNPPDLVEKGFARLRRALEADSGCLRARGCLLRTGSASDGNRLRHRHGGTRD
jgi:hypothetical protein